MDVKVVKYALIDLCLLSVFLQPLHPNSTGNCTTVDGKPAELVDVNGTHCTSGLGLSETQFNLLYAIFAWTLVEQINFVLFTFS